MKYAVRVWKEQSLVKQKGPYDSVNQAQVALDLTKARGWIPDDYRTEIVDWDTGIPSMRNPDL